MDEAEKERFRDHLRRQRAGYEFIELERFRELRSIDHREVLTLFDTYFLERHKRPLSRESGLAEWSRKLQLAYS